MTRLRTRGDIPPLPNASSERQVYLHAYKQEFMHKLRSLAYRVL